ncbi:MAG: NADH-quinone oxidoreductase subunit N [Chloroflexota bacterium]
MSYEPSMLLAILPEILLVVLAGVVLALDAFWPDERRRALGWVTAVGLAIILFLSVAVSRPPATPELIFGGMIRDDGLGFAFRLLFLFGGLITALFALDFDAIGRKGEFYILMLISILGMNLMASAGDLVMLYLAIETASIPLYVLAGFVVRDAKSAEAGFKYLLFGAMSSAILLYGFSLLYGFTGTTSLYGLIAELGQLPVALLLVVLGLVLAGFSFKISAVPFHFWAPDVYEGAPTPVAGFLSTASKAAGFAVLMRVLQAAFPEASASWQMILGAIAIVTMTLGNLLALAQHNVKRLLAYSSIAHAGYILIGVVAIAPTGMGLGFPSVVFYLIAYLLTNLAAFGAVAAFERVSGRSDFDAYKGLSRRSPALALVLLVAFLSLSGMPPFGGFIAKVFVFAAAVDADFVLLAVIGVLNSIVGLYYYLTVLKYIYLYRQDDPAEEQKPLPLSRPYALALLLLVGGILLLGTWFAPWFGWSQGAAASLF